MILRPVNRIARVQRSAGHFFTTSTILNNSLDETPETKPLYGTVPSHRSYIFLHSPEPPATFPPRVSTPIQRALMLRVIKWGGIVNFSWHPSNRHSADNTHASATAFSIAGGRLEIPEISLENVDEVAQDLRRHVEGPLVKNLNDEINLYVCTHGARDCRCGNIGGDVVRALRDEVKRRTDVDPTGLASRVKVNEVGHVGGHKWAANLLIFPHGEWLGSLTPGDVPDVLNSILQHPPTPFSPIHPPMYPERWRGRMGLSKDEQLELYMTSRQ